MSRQSADGAPVVPPRSHLRGFPSSSTAPSSTYSKVSSSSSSPMASGRTSPERPFVLAVEPPSGNFGSLTDEPEVEEIINFRPGPQRKTSVDQHSHNGRPISGNRDPLKIRDQRPPRKSTSGVYTRTLPNVVPALCTASDAPSSFLPRTSRKPAFAISHIPQSYFSDLSSTRVARFRPTGYSCAHILGLQAHFGCRLTNVRAACTTTPEPHEPVPSSCWSHLRPYGGSSLRRTSSSRPPARLLATDTTIVDADTTDVHADPTIVVALVARITRQLLASEQLAVRQVCQPTDHAYHSQLALRRPRQGGDRRRLIRGRAPSPAWARPGADPQAVPSF